MSIDLTEPTTPPTSWKRKALHSELFTLNLFVEEIFHQCIRRQKLIGINLDMVFNNNKVLQPI